MKVCVLATRIHSHASVMRYSMNERIRRALVTGGILAVIASVAGADMTAETSIPDPARAWQLRDFAPVQAWLASETGSARMTAHSPSDHSPGDNSPGDNSPSDASVPVLRAQAWLARREGETDRALTLLDTAIENAPDLPELRVDRAAFRSDRIEDSGPFASLRIARDVRGDLEHALAVAPQHADALAALAAFHLKAPGIAGGDKQAAKALLARLGELAPSRRLFRESAELADAERFAEAVERVAEALSGADGPTPDWHVRMGDWLHRLGRHEGALAAYREALTETPEHTGALYALGRMAAESGLAAEAGRDALQRFLELPRWPQDPGASSAWWQMGRIHAHAGCFELAEQAFRRALELDPDWREPRRSLRRLDAARDSENSCVKIDQQPSAG